MADHNEFVTKAMRDIGPGLIAQGSVPAQLVAAESLLAGMIGLIARMDSMSLWRAEGLMRAVAKGAEDRLRVLYREATDGQ